MIKLRPWKTVTNADLNGTEPNVMDGGIGHRFIQAEWLCFVLGDDGE